MGKNRRASSLRWTASILLVGFVLMVGPTGRAQVVFSNEIKDFQTDGCTAFPDGNYLECCVRHDLAYWKGGTLRQKVRADNDLRACVSDLVNRAVPVVGFIQGALMQIGVTVAAGFDWGYGWKYERGFAPLSELSYIERERLLEAESRIPRDLGQVPITDRNVEREVYPSVTGNYCVDEVNRYLAEYTRDTGDEVTLLRASEYRMLNSVLAYQIEIVSDECTTRSRPLTAQLSTPTFANCEPHERDKETDFFVRLAQIPQECPQLRDWNRGRTTIGVSGN